MSQSKCCICGSLIHNIKLDGHNPEPLLNAKGERMSLIKGDVCCSTCNLKYVLPFRSIEYLSAGDKSAADAIQQEVLNLMEKKQ